MLRRLLAATLTLIIAPATAAMPEVRIGVGLTKPPYIMETGDSGIEFEIAEKALDASGYRMLAQHLPPARALALLRAGMLDGMLTVDEGIGGNGFFSDIYMHYQNVAITLASRGIRLRGVEDLDQYSIAAFQNASLILGPDFKALAEHHRDYKEHSQQITQNRLLYTGRVDVVIGDRLIFRYLNKQVEASINTGQPLVHHVIFKPSARKAVFRDPELREAFNAGLKKIRKNGAYAAIYKKYNEPVEP